MIKLGPELSSRDRQQLRALLVALAPVQAMLSLPMVVALLTLAIEPGLSVNELAERTGTPQQTASRYVSILTGRYENPLLNSSLTPLITQEIHSQDPRKRALFLSVAGWKFIASLLNAASNQNKE